MPVWNGSTWVNGKKAKAWNGSSWVLAWVPPVTTATLSVSKSGVEVGEAYSIYLDVPGGFPEGALVTFRLPAWQGYVSPSEGATRAEINGLSHAEAGDWTWYADVSTAGGDTTFGPLVQTASPAAPQHYHEVVPSGSSRAAIQAAMDRAYNFWAANQSGTHVDFDDESTMACVELVSGGVYTLDGRLYTRRGVRLFGGGSGASRPLVYSVAADSHLLVADQNGGGGYNAPHFDWLLENIRFDCQSWAGGLSIGHTSRFRVKGCDFANMGGKKHYIEINSSGGPRGADGVYNVEVLDCYFTMPNASANPEKPRRNIDECIQLDYAWPGAAYGLQPDGTVANNVRIAGCTFHQVPRAIGAHKYEIEQGVTPASIPWNVLIEDNVFTRNDPRTPAQGGYGDGAGGSSAEGTVRSYVWSNVRVLNNQFTDCYAPFRIYTPSDAYTGHGSPTYIVVDGNTFTDCDYGRYAIYGDSNAMKTHQVLIQNNVVDGQWSGSSDVYMAGCDHTDGLLPASSFGCVIRWNTFRPDNYSVAGEAAYNKFRAGNSSNLTGVYIYQNWISDGSEDNS
jgi:hypothetical protein